MCLCIVFAATSCDETNENDTKDTVPTTVTLLGITEKSTTSEAIKAVEDAINKITKARYKTKVELKLVTEDEYLDLINKSIERAEYYKNYDAAVATYNSYMKNEANSVSGTKKIFGNWIKKQIAISAETIQTRDLYLEERTTVHPDGTIETLYPEALSPIDIVMIADEQMYDRFDELGLLMPVEASSTSYKNLQKYIYPTFFSELKNLKGSISAIPNNNMLAEYTYILVNKELADKYDFNIGTFSGYSDISSFLSEVKANESCVPFASVPEALGIFKLFGDDVALGTYFDPINGYVKGDSTTAQSSFKVENLFELPQYTDHLKLMEEYKKAGYFDGDADKDGFAVKVVTGDASIQNIYDNDESDYYVKVIQNPFVLREAIFDGMFAVTSYTSNKDRAMEILEAINTDSQVKNLLQYGIEGVNYTVNEDDTVTRLNSDYMMDNALTGNVYMGHLEEGMGNTSWAYVKQTNLVSLASPFLVFPVDEAYLESNLNEILKRTALDDALAPMGVTYAEYQSSASTSKGNKYRDNLKKYYKSYFLDCLREDGISEDSLESVFAGNNPAITWYEEKIEEKIISEKYVTIKTSGALETLIKTKMLDSIGVTLESFNTETTNAADYYKNITSLRILSTVTLFSDLSYEEYQEKYGNLSSVEFENAVIEYVRENYIKQNNISESDYDVLVKSLMSSALKFYNSSNEAYVVTWEEFEEIKQQSAKFADAVDKISEAYISAALDYGYTQEQLDAMNDVRLATVIHDCLYYQYYSGYNFTKAAYEDYLYGEMLAPIGISYKDLNALKRSDPDAYAKNMATLKKTYKKQLMETRTKSEYEAISNTQLLSVLLEYFIEDYTQVYHNMCDAAGISYDEYREYLGYMETYIRYVEKMKSEFTYTLRTVYTEEEINSFNFDELEQKLYDAVYNYGYYTNEMAKYVGMTLNEYMRAKSNAVKYTNYITSLVDAYASDLRKHGFDVEAVKKYDSEVIVDLIYSIVEEKDFADYKSVVKTLEDYCKSYMEGLANATDIDAYCKSSAEAVNANTFFKILKDFLNEDLAKKLSAN